MEWLTLGIFCAALLVCITLNISILFALVLGLVIFLLYGRHKGYAWNALAHMAIRGVMEVRNILITFLLIGILTALWRASGTIAVIVCYASAFIRPSIFLLMAFLLNCVVSVLTGTSFGTAATMGVICTTMAASAGIDIRLAGGAVLSGIFFGDRCSPVSTSALLVAELTETNIYDNIRRMVRSALVPFVCTCVVYTVMGLTTAHAGELMDLESLFAREFTLHWAALVPAVIIMLLSCMRVNVKLAMTASILAALPICIVMQHIAPLDLLQMAFTGFHASDTEVAAMIDGGGIRAMLKVAGIVCLSSSYSHLFLETGLLDGVKRAIEMLAHKTTTFTAMFCTSVLAGMIACNQTLSIMLEHQLCGDLADTKADLANDIEDSAVIIAPIIPWSIAGAVPLSAIGAPTSAILFGCYLYLIPLWRLVCSFRRRS